MSSQAALHSSQVNQTTINRVIRIKELCELLGVANSTVYRWIKSDGLPSPVKLGGQSVGWRMAEIQAWLDSRQSSLIREVA